MQLTVQVTLICSKVELRETALAMTLKSAGPKERKGETKMKHEILMTDCHYGICKCRSVLLHADCVEVHPLVVMSNIHTVSLSSCD